MEITGQPDGPPTKVGPGIGDLFTAVLNAVGILAAVHHRDRTGEGQYVDTAMYDAMVSLAERTVYQYSCDGEAPTRQGNSHPTLFPYDAFETSDGYVVIAAFSNGHWARLCEAMDRPDLAAEFPDGASRRANREQLRGAIAEWTRKHGREEILTQLEGTVPTAPVQTAADVFEDPHVREREMLTDLSQPGTDEEMTVAGRPIMMTETRPRPKGRAPLLDEHREELLEERGQTGDCRAAESGD
jgi:succinyl-CoA:mesaconate CoA transferase